MNQTWDLSVLYKDFDDPAYAADMAALVPPSPLCTSWRRWQEHCLPLN